LIPGTTHAATPRAAADTRIRSRIFMALFLPDGGEAVAENGNARPF
jgi:hypothetical protein